MSSIAAVSALADVSAAQWGLLTTAQANDVGVSRVQLTRLAQQGLIERLTQGVYRDAHIPENELDGLRATWLSTEPGLLAEQRLANPSAIVSGRTAAYVHGLGDLVPEPYEFSTPKRRQTQRPELRYRHQPLTPNERTIIAGLPVTTIERTIADLLRAREDRSLVADALADGVRGGIVDLDELTAHLAPLAARNGHPPNDGRALLQQLLESGGVDTASLLRHLTETTLWQAMPIAPFAATMSEHVSEAFTHAVTDAFRTAYPSLSPSIDTAALTNAAFNAINVDHLWANMSADFFAALTPTLPATSFIETTAILDQLATRPHEYESTDDED